MEVLILTETERRVIFDNHPLITKDYQIITPVIEAIYSIVRDRVWMRSTGTVMYGDPRFGKSICAEIIKKLLIAEFPNLFIIKFTAETNRKVEAGIFIDILQAEGLMFPKSSRFKDLQRQLITHIQSKLTEKSANQFVLMVDEMHKLNTNELDILSTIHNRLDSLHVRMTTIGFAQSEILNTITGLKTTSQKYLIARFLNEPIPFDGCANQSNLEIILDAYDVVLTYPENSDCSFTRFFFPFAFENGFRMKTYVKPIWKALQDASERSESQTIPMLYLCKTIEYLLVIYSKMDKPKFVFKKEDIVVAVNASGLSVFS